MSRRGSWVGVGMAVAGLLAGCGSSPLAPPRAAVAAAGLEQEGTVQGPGALVGSYRGILTIHGHERHEVAMGLDVVPTDDPSRYRWSIRYGEGSDADVRDYVLVADDVASGACRIDEQNGIELFAHLRDGELVAAFAVAGQTLVTRYRLRSEGIEFALESFPTAAAQATGKGVETFPRVARQRALLRRVN